MVLSKSDESVFKAFVSVLNAQDKGYCSLHAQPVVFHVDHPEFDTSCLDKEKTSALHLP